MDAAPAVGSAAATRTSSRIPGLLLAIAVAAAAIYFSSLPFPPFTLPDQSHPLEPVMLAIILGMIVGALLPRRDALTPGFKFASRRLLPLGIVLLGARLDFLAILKVGAAGMALSVLTILAGLGLFLLFVRSGWIERKLGLLLGIGTAICGGTAIVAAAPIVRAKDDEVAYSVATVTLVGLVTMFALPLVGRAMGMSDWAFGVWSGLSIHQTPQVIAAGFAYSSAAGETATVVKLARVSLLAPALLLIGWLAARAAAPAGETAGDGQGTRRFRLAGVFPVFVLGFLAMALLRTLGWLPTIHVGGATIDVVEWCDTLSKLLIVTAMAAVGLETRFGALRSTGARPILLSAAAAGVVLGLILLATVATPR